MQKTAIKEVKEEGGVEAKIVGKVGTEKYFYKHGYEWELKTGAKEEILNRISFTRNSVSGLGVKTLLLIMNSLP